MGDLPTLIVEHEAIIHGILMSGHDPVIRIDGPLPTVRDVMLIGMERPLRVGDQVTLAYDVTEFDEQAGKELAIGTVPFATATVAEIKRVDQYPEAESWLVTVTDVEALGQ